MDKKRVLIFPSGSEGALEIYNALRYNLHFELYGFSGKKNYTDFIYPPGRYYYGDERLFVNHKDFKKTFIDLLKRFEIQYIIPTFDDVALQLTKIGEELPATVVASPYETVTAASDKRLMYQEIRDLDFCPTVYAKAEAVDSYPVFVKPACSTGSKGTALATDFQQLQHILSAQEEPVICEYLPGEEATVDCFTDRHGQLLFVGPRMRERIWHGITFRGKTIPLTEQLGNIAEQLNARLKFRGAWFFQAKRDRNGQFKLLEFSARQATNSSLYTKLGINFSLLSLFDAMEMDVDILFNDCPIEQERKLCASYRFHWEYDAVYIDLDDTLIVHGAVNTTAMKFLYQCINRRKRLVLLTRHFLNLDETLGTHRISKNIFDEIIWIRDDTPKANYIAKERAIFIDNYFKERVLVKKRLGIPVFDVDAIDCLIDDRLVREG